MQSSFEITTSLSVAEQAIRSLKPDREPFISLADLEMHARSNCKILIVVEWRPLKLTMFFSWAKDTRICKPLTDHQDQPIENGLAADLVQNACSFLARVWYGVNIWLPVSSHWVLACFLGRECNVAPSTTQRSQSRSLRRK